MTCFVTKTLSVGDDNGLVRLELSYKLTENLYNLLS